MSTDSPKSSAKDQRRQPQVKLPAITFYAILLCVVIVASIAIGRLTPFFIPHAGSRAAIRLAAQIGGFCVAFVLLHLMVELSINNTQTMKKLWPLRQVSRFRNWLWSGVVLSLGFGMLGNYLYEEGKGGEPPSAAPQVPVAVPAPQAVATEASVSLPPAKASEKPASSKPATGTPARGTPDAAMSPESYCNLTFLVPTRFRDLQILVDGEPARVTDRQLSLIKLQVPRKSSPIRFTLQSSLLSKPREFTLVVDRDQLEYSPFQ